MSNDKNAIAAHSLSILLHRKKNNNFYNSIQQLKVLIRQLTYFLRFIRWFAMTVVNVV